MDWKASWIPTKEKGVISLAIGQPHRFGLWGVSSGLCGSVSKGLWALDRAVGMSVGVNSVNWTQSNLVSVAPLLEQEVLSHTRVERFLYS